MRIQELLIPHIPIRHHETLIHHDHAGKQFINQFHIVCGDQHRDRSSRNRLINVHLARGPISAEGSSKRVIEWMTGKLSRVIQNHQPETQIKKRLLKFGGAF